MRYVILIITCFFLVSGVSIIAQHPVYNQAYESQEDVQRNALAAIHVDAAGFIYGVGRTIESSDFDSDSLRVIKIDPKGKYCWNKTYELSPGQRQIAQEIQSTNDGNLIIGGLVQDVNDFDVFAFLLKMDTLGNVLWYREYGPENFETYIRHIHETADNGFVVGFRSTLGGEQSKNAWAMKVDSLGNQEWEFVLDNGFSSQVRGIFEQSYGYLLVILNVNIDLPIYLGSSSLYKINWEGELIESIGPLEEFAARLEVVNSLRTEDGHLLLIGTNSENGSYISDGYLMKVDTTGSLIWTSQINYSSTTTEELSRACEMSDGSFIAT